MISINELEASGRAALSKELRITQELGGIFYVMHV